MPLHQYRRQKFIRFSTDDCFAAFCQSGLAFAAPKEHWYYSTKPPWANAAASLGLGRWGLIEPKELSAAKREASAVIRVGKGKMREWDRLDAADFGGGMAVFLQSKTWSGRSSRRVPKRATGVCGPSGSLSVIRGSMKRTRPDSASMTVLRPGWRSEM